MSSNWNQWNEGSNNPTGSWPSLPTTPTPGKTAIPGTSANPNVNLGPGWNGGVGAQSAQSASGAAMNWSHGGANPFTDVLNHVTGFNAALAGRGGGAGNDTMPFGSYPPPSGGYPLGGGPGDPTRTGGGWGPAGGGYPMPPNRPPDDPGDPGRGLIGPGYGGYPPPPSAPYPPWSASSLAYPPAPPGGLAPGEGPSDPTRTGPGPWGPSHDLIRHLLPGGPGGDFPYDPSGGQQHILPGGPGGDFPASPQIHFARGALGGDGSATLPNATTPNGPPIGVRPPIVDPGPITHILPGGPGGDFPYVPYDQNFGRHVLPGGPGGDFPYDPSGNQGNPQYRVGASSGLPAPATNTQQGSYQHTAINPTTGHRIGSSDFGNTWYDLRTGWRVS